MTDKARILVTATKELHALDGQYFVLSARGKSWELWNEGGAMALPHRVTTIPRKRVLWVVPMEESAP